MARENHQLWALIQVKPSEARAKILAAYERSKCLMRGAAEILGCDRSTLAIWVKKLEMQPALDQMKERAKKKGWHHDRNRLGGRAPGGKNRPKEAAT